MIQTKPKKIFSIGKEDFHAQHIIPFYSRIKLGTIVLEAKLMHREE